jgi:hypothetical protein
VNEGPNRRLEARRKRWLSHALCQRCERGTDVIQIAQEPAHEGDDGAGRGLAIEPIGERRESRDPARAERVHRLVRVEQRAPSKGTSRLVVVVRYDLDVLIFRPYADPGVAAVLFDRREGAKTKAAPQIRSLGPIQSVRLPSHEVLRSRCRE